MKRNGAGFKVFPPAVSEELVSLGDATIYVRRLSSASARTPSKPPVLIFLHDSLGCVDTWRDFPDELARRVELNAMIYDRQGYGRSSPFGSASRTPEYLEVEATVLFTLLDALAIDTVVLFGHSDGGSIALIAAAMRPERVAAVVTEGAHVFVDEVTLAGIRATQAAVETTDLRARLARYHGEKVQAVLDAWTDTWLSSAFRSWNIERYLPVIACPVLAIQGHDDEFGTVAQVHAIIDGVGASAELLLIPAVGHTPHREARDEVLASATAFIRAGER